MATERTQLGLFQYSTVGLLLAALASLILNESQLGSPRPEDPSTTTRGAKGGDEVIPARLWQDPIDTVQQWLNTRDEAERRYEAEAEWEWFGVSLPAVSVAGSEEDAAQMIRERVESVPLAPVTSGEALRVPSLVLLGVMVDGTATSEAAERRRRQRQATLSALGREGYIPESADRLGVIEWEDSLVSAHSIGRRKGRVPVPFEWFKRDPVLGPTGARATLDRAPHVLVVWLDEAHLEMRDPLQHIGRLYADLLVGASEFLSSSGQTASRFSQQIQLRLIGGSNSGSLGAVLQRVVSFSDGVSGANGRGESRLQQLLDLARRYLDDELPEAQGAAVQARERELVSQLARWDMADSQDFEVWLNRQSSGQLEDALMSAFPDVVDRDLNWAETIGSRFVRFTIRAAPGPHDFDAWRRTLIEEVLREAGTYLDQGLPDSPAKSAGQVGATDFGHQDFIDATDWLNESSLSGPIVAQLNARSELARKLEQRYPDVKDSDPYWARSVVELWCEAAPKHSLRPEELLSALQIFSPRASAPRELVATHPGLQELLANSNSTELDPFLKRPGSPWFRSTIAQDHQLALTLVDELARRGVRPFDGNYRARDHVVLLSEWDTVYGRALPTVLEAAARYRVSHPAPLSGDGVADRKEWDRKVAGFVAHPGSGRPGGPFQHVTYLRGLDGRTSRTSAQSREPSNSRNSDPLDKDAFSADNFQEVVNAQSGIAEPSIGPERQDQLRRLANELRSVKQARDRAGRGGRLAIGVLGSDFYDKQLIISALHEQFPDAVFFTTGADARYLQREHNSENRNLIIASSYGLTLSRSVGGANAPFRDGYQSADFMAARLALLPPTQSHTLWAKVVDAVATPRVFEVGRKQLVDISPFTTKNGVHPRPDRGVPWRGRTFNFVIVLVLGSLFLVSVNHSVRKTIRRERVFVAKALLLILVAAAALTAVIVKDSGSGGGEPFELAAGVSIWPTEILRFLSAVLACVMLAASCKALQSNQTKLARRYGLPDSSTAPERRWWSRDPDDTHNWFSQLWSRRRRISIERWTRFTRRARPKTSIEECWIEYMRLSRPGNRFARVLPMAISYMLLAFSLMALFGFPQTPYRGSVSLITDKVVLILSVGLLLVLTFFVIDATRLAAQFVDAVSRASSRWPAGKSARASSLARKRGLKAKLLKEFLTLEFIARRTRVVERLIQLPFVILLLMMLARHSIFDKWTTPLSLAIVFVLMATLALASSITLTTAAQGARARLRARMKARLSRLHARECTQEAKSFELLMSEADAIHVGAFGSWFGNPALKAVLIPSGGYGLLAVLEALAGASAG
ncbi:MAG: hypothetical protein DHS20C15_13830 [Planctomycetota bacterium]|nr:MAG: hypothetical protein DHS20C15_13830 [Planctomycetota bacterium]